MWTAARDFGVMDRNIRAGRWLRCNAVQLTGKTLGLVGFGGIAAELARLAKGAGMTVIAWNRSPIYNRMVPNIRKKPALRLEHG